MDLLLILTYTAICFGIFKFFKIPLNKWTVPTAVLGGIVLIGSLLLLMNYNHPYSERAQMVTVTLPIIPEVEGVVVEVTPHANQTLKKGDFLFRIDPTAYEAKVEALKGEIETAQQNVEMLKARLASENADIAQAKAVRDLALKDANRYQNGSKDKMKSPFTDQEVVRAQQNYLAAQAQWRSVLSKRDETAAQLNAMINGENAAVYRIKSKLKEAEYFLARTVVYAPSDGYATQLLLKPGMFVRPLPLRPVMVFVPEQKNSVFAVFRQNSALRLTAGDEAEVVFNGLPGSVVKGKVKQILPVVASSSYQAQGHLQGLSLDPKLDGIYAEIELNNMADMKNLPAGTMGQVAIYSDYFKHVSIIRKILLRMTSWMHYLYIDH